MKKFLMLFVFVSIFAFMLMGCEGDQGEPGKNGSSGIQGLRGLAGIVGPSGPDGSDGLNGADGVPQCAPGKVWNPQNGHCRKP